MFGKDPVPKPPEGWKSVRPLGIVTLAISVVIFAVGIVIQQQACLFAGAVPFFVSLVILRKWNIDTWKRELPFNYTLYDMLEKEIPRTLGDNGFAYSEEEIVGITTPVNKETDRAYARLFRIPGTPDELSVFLSMHMINSHQSGPSYFFSLSIKNVSLKNEEMARRLTLILDQMLHRTAAMNYVRRTKEPGQDHFL